MGEIKNEESSEPNTNLVPFLDLPCHLLPLRPRVLGTGTTGALEGQKREEIHTVSTSRLHGNKSGETELLCVLARSGCIMVRWGGLVLLNRVAWSTSI